MGRQSCCVKQKLRKGLWSPEEDEKLYNYVARFGVGCWTSVPNLAGLQRCGKSCRLRWINYLRPDLKRGMFSQEEEDLIISLHKSLGNRWAQIATQLPGRTDNEIKNFWNSCLKKKLLKQGIDPITHMPVAETDVKKEKEANLLEMDGQDDCHLTCNNPDEGMCSRDNLVVTRQVAYNNPPMFLPDFQTSIEYNPSCFPSHKIGNLARPMAFEQDLSAMRFNSMPNLTAFDHQNNGDYSDCSSSSRISTLLMNEAKENGNGNGNGNAYSWDSGNNLESLFQFSGIENEERKGGLFEDYQNLSSDFFNYYPLASLSQENLNLGAFPQL